MGNAVDITGQVFGKLTAIKRDGRDKRNNALWLCRCECGNECIRSLHDLKKKIIIHAVAVQKNI